MDWLSAVKDVIVSAEGLGLLGIMYTLWWLSGRIPNLFKPAKWDWKRGLEDLCKLLLMVVTLLGIIGVANLGAQFYAKLGFDITEGVATFSSYALMGAMAGGFVYYGKLAATNAWNWFKLKISGAADGNKEQFEQGKEEIANGTIEIVKQFVEYIAPAVKPNQETQALPKKEIQKAVEEAQMGASIPVAAILEQLKTYATQNAFLKEDGSSGIYRGQCTQVPAFVYNQIGVSGSMGNGKNVVKNLIARGVAEACGEEPGAIASSDDGSEYGHTWVSLGNGYLIEQNACVAGTATANYGVGTVYSCRVGRLNEWNRGKVTYCRLKGLAGPAVSTTKPKTEAAKPNNDIKAGDKVNVVNYVDVNGTALKKLQNTPYTVYQVRQSDKTAVLKSNDGDIYGRLYIANIKKV